MVSLVHLHRDFYFSPHFVRISVLKIHLESWHVPALLTANFWYFTDLLAHTVCSITSEVASYPSELHKAHATTSKGFSPNVCTSQSKTNTQRNDGWCGGSLWDQLCSTKSNTDFQITAESLNKFSGCLDFILKDGFPTQVGTSQKTSIFHSEGPLHMKSSNCLVQTRLLLHWLNYSTVVQAQGDCYKAFNMQAAHHLLHFKFSLDKSKSRLPLPEDQHHFWHDQAEANFLKLNLPCQSCFQLVYVSKAQSSFWDFQVWSMSLWKAKPFCTLSSCSSYPS